MVELYCDESRQDLFYNKEVISNTNKYIFIGGIMVDRSEREEITQNGRCGLTDDDLITIRPSMEVSKHESTARKSMPPRIVNTFITAFVTTSSERSMMVN